MKKSEAIRKFGNSEFPIKPTNDYNLDYINLYILLYKIANSAILKLRKVNCFNYMVTSKAKLNYSKVADFFLAFANSKGDLLTNLKLQKLVYYAQAWYLANYKTPLFDDDFEAWIHGPVLRKLYTDLKNKGFYLSTPISSDVRIKNVEKDLNNIDPKLFPFLEEVAKVYFPYTAYELEFMTHQEDPWIKARGNLEPTDRCTNIITKPSMCEFYGKRIQN